MDDDATETPAKLDAMALSSKHRRAFNMDTFGDKDGNGSDLNTVKSSSKVWSQAEYGKRLAVLDPANWGPEDLSDLDNESVSGFKAFRQQHMREYSNWN